MAMTGYWKDLGDCLWSPWQCVKAAGGDDEAYRAMKMPEEAAKQAQQVTVLPRTTTPIADSQVPYGPGCAPGWVYHEGMGTCMRDLTKQPPKSPVYVTPGPDGQPMVVQQEMDRPTSKAVVILATVLVGAAVYSLFRSR